ncbi:uncharacterized protein LACBIDRAFT_308596 [Laccaria bicolor S238N-H82]|uniref:Predicted protein n=1 Tax=Laccaria bicolor (strain S238N-H82 / ATCC MYA-4686) TaxID=486041 RepID=B0CWR1_LACBS|nr:uncharacterized protein LACBIDRAFT_308596 [Laccaria bicolor S238N-H82]EDR13113.1 predicted protein [Laccaria bicolor S238N-H82]|eukprot:XP_001875611.1 predicted protein [Laccaria bicolor S238N-H82]
MQDNNLSLAASIFQESGAPAEWGTPLSVKIILAQKGIATLQLPLAAVAHDTTIIVYPIAYPLSPPSFTSASSSTPS